ncbi:MAG: SHOCT domain-containing protein [Acidimicrobiales bacterium]
MPGLLRGVARTAVVAGTATAVSGRVQRRQAEKFADRDQAIAANRGQGYYEGAQQAQYQQPQYAPPPPQYAPPPPAEPQVDMVAELKQLAELHDQGILTDEEFAAQKAKILG